MKTNEINTSNYGITAINELLRAYYYHSYKAQKGDNHIKLFTLAHVDILFYVSDKYGISGAFNHYESIRSAHNTYGPSIYNRHQFYKKCLDKLLCSINIDIETLKQELNNPYTEYLDILLKNNENLFTKINNKVKKIKLH